MTRPILYSYEAIIKPNGHTVVPRFGHYVYGCILTYVYQLCKARGAMIQGHVTFYEDIIMLHHVMICVLIAACIYQHHIPCMLQCYWDPWYRLSNVY